MVKLEQEGLEEQMKNEWMVRAFIGVALAGVSQGRMWGQETLPGGAQTQAAEAGEMERWRGVMERLGATDFGVREAAQGELKKAGWREKGTLKKLAEGARDEEVKARLLARVEEIDEQLAVDPPPISLDVKDATLAEVATALGKAVGQDITALNTIGRQTYTLKAVDQPFWEIFLALTRQHGMQMQTYERIRIQRSDPGWTNGRIVGGVAIIPMSISWVKNVNLQAPGAVPQGSMSFHYIVAFDPRMKVLSSQAQMVEMVDEQSNGWLQRNQPAQLPRMMGPQITTSYSETLAVPANPGKKIVSAKGQVRILLAMEEARAEVAEVDKKVKQPLEVGGQTITFDKFDLQGMNLSMMINHKNPIPGKALPANVNVAIDRSDVMGVNVVVEDSRGTRIWSGMVTGAYSVSHSGPALTPPFKAILTAPTRTKEVVVPFELKDLPLPG